MHIYINDFSFQPTATQLNLESILKDFSDVCERSKKCSFEKIYMPNDFKSREVLSSRSLAQFINEAPKGSALATRLKSIIANQLKKIDNDEEDPKIQYVEYKGKESEFFKRAFNKKVPVISFKSQIDFDADFFLITDKQLIENEIIESNGEIVNISKIEHFDIHRDLISKIQIHKSSLEEKWDALKNPFRFTERVIQYLDDNDFSNKCKNINSSQRVSLANSIGKNVAAMIGWIYNSNLSRKNNRVVFKALNQNAYLSIDTETISFELHNKRGDHEGEYNFIGEKLEDGKGHKLIVK